MSGQSPGRVRKFFVRQPGALSQERLMRPYPSQLSVAASPQKKLHAMNKTDHEVTAVFNSADEAQQARAMLQEQLGHPPELMRISADVVLHVEVTLEDMEPVAQALRSGGATGIKYSERPRSPGWMSHQQGRATGSCVAPGEGDAEAGSLDHRT
jgi:hypothetical protein